MKKLGKAGGKFKINDTISNSPKLFEIRKKIKVELVQAYKYLSACFQFFYKINMQKRLFCQNAYDMRSKIRDLRILYLHPMFNKVSLFIQKL